jgi:hypothetical protein
MSAFRPSGSQSEHLHFNCILLIANCILISSLTYWKKSKKLLDESLSFLSITNFYIIK